MFLDHNINFMVYYPNIS